MSRLFLRVSSAFAGGLLTFGCLAQSAMPARADWEFSVGFAVFSEPKYLGAKERRTLPIPIAEAEGPYGLFVNVERGFGQEIQLGESTRFAYSLALDLNSRRRKDDERFGKLADLREAAAARVEIEQDIGGWTFNATALSRLGSAEQAGATASLEASYELTESRDFLWSAGLNAKIMDGRFARNFFGVSSAQAAASGLPAYDAGAGLYRTAPFLQLLATIDDDWTFFGRLEAGRLRGDAAASPLVRQQRGEVLVLSASRVF